MSRKDEFKTNKNPAKHFLEWKSDDKCFSYYDKEKQENVIISLPFKFLTLMEMHTVKGWHDPSQSSIFSNEVKKIGSEPLHVRAFKAGTIAKGLYKNIKPMLSGGRYVKSIYIMDEHGNLLNIQLKGAAVHAWGEFVNNGRTRITEEWVSVYDFEEKQKGSITYSIPVFKFDQSLNDAQYGIADDLYNELSSYMDEYLQPNEKEVTEKVYEDANTDAAKVSQYDPVVVEEEDDLPF